MGLGFCRQRGGDNDFSRKLDRLVAARLTQEDYRELRAIASKKFDLSVREAAEAVFSDWINDRGCKGPEPPGDGHEVF